jgi:hypothetical protein
MARHPDEVLGEQAAADHAVERERAEGKHDDQRTDVSG